MTTDDILTVEDMAALLHCEPQTVEEHTRCGKLPGVKLGRSWVYPRTAVLEVLHHLALKQTEAKPTTTAPPLPGSALKETTQIPRRGRRRIPPPLPQIV